MPPEIGDRVKVWPRPGLKVQVEDIFNRFIPEEGAEVTWSFWYFSRFRDGSVMLHDPTEAPAKAPSKTSK